MTPEDVKQLLAGVVSQLPLMALGVATDVPKERLKSAIRQRQASFHSDRTNDTAVSQLANACAEAANGKGALTQTHIALAKALLRDVERREWDQKTQDFEGFTRRLEEEAKKAHYDRVMTPENIERAERLVASFERVPRSKASRSTDVRAAFQRALGLNGREVGWIMDRLGIGAAVNSRRVKVAHIGVDGLKLPDTTTQTCCPNCGFLLSPQQRVPA
jgi:hypothetical protein